MDFLGAPAPLNLCSLRKAATITLDEAAGVFGGSRDDEAQLAQYYVAVQDGDKDLVTYVMLKLGLLSGRGVLFVNSVDRCYRLKLFLDLFSIRTLVLNAELPLASRLHAIEAYNRGYYDLLVATEPKDAGHGGALIAVGSADLKVSFVSVLADLLSCSWLPAAASHGCSSNTDSNTHDAYTSTDARTDSDM